MPFENDGLRGGWATRGYNPKMKLDITPANYPRRNPTFSRHSRTIYFVHAQRGYEIIAFGNLLLMLRFSYRFVCQFLCIAVLIFSGAEVALSQTDAEDDASSTSDLVAVDSSPAASEALLRVRTLVRANVLGLAQDILENHGPEIPQSLREPATTVTDDADAITGPTVTDTTAQEWLQWQRQLWALYEVSGQWQKLYSRTQNLPAGLPLAARREADLLAIAALSAMQKGAAARRFIRAQLADATEALAADEIAHERRLRRAVIATYLADDLLADARVAMTAFRKDYGATDTDWLLLAAGVEMRTGNLDAAVNLLAPLDSAAAKLLRLYARLGNRSIEPEQVIDRAFALRDVAGAPPTRDILAVMAQATITAGKFYPLADLLEDYLLTAPSDADKIYPRFSVADLFAVYARIATEQANKAGLLVGDDAAWLAYARGTSPQATVVRRAIFAHLAAGNNSLLRQQAIDEYINVLIDINRSKLIPHLFAPDTRFGELTLGGVTALRLAAHALHAGDYALAAAANATLSELPAGIARSDWLLQAARIDIFAGLHDAGAAKLHEWLTMHPQLTGEQTDAVLQPIFDLQTVARHELALDLLPLVNARAPTAKHRREIAYWLAESHQGNGQPLLAADLFLFSALQRADGFDRWGEAARFRAADALLEAQLFDDARRLLEDMLARTKSESSRNALQQKLQRLWLLQNSSVTE